MQKIDETDPYLKNIPVMLFKANKKFDIIDKGEQIFLAQRNDDRLHKILRRLGFKVPKVSYLELDLYSSYVFKSIDGKRDIYTIGKRLKSKFGEDCEPLYERLVVYLEDLKNNKRWIEYK